MEKGAIVVEIAKYVRLQAMHEALVKDASLRTEKNVEEALDLVKTFESREYTEEPKAKFEIGCIREWMKRAKDTTKVWVWQGNWHESDEYNSVVIQIKNRWSTPLEEFDAIFEEERGQEWCGVCEPRALNF